MPTKNKTFTVGDVGPKGSRKNVRRPQKKLTWHLIFQSSCPQYNGLTFQNKKQTFFG